MSFFGDIFKAAAPIAAGYFTGGSGASLFGLGQTGSAIAAGAMTGAGIAGLSGDDILGGAFTGGLGGLSGGSLANAAAKTAEIEALKQAGAPTMSINKAAIDAVKPQGMFSSTAGVTQGIPMNAGIPAASPSSGMFAKNLGVSQPIRTGSLNAGPTLTGSNVGGGGYVAPPTLGESTSAAFRNPGEFLNQLGDGSKAMGAGKLGITGLGVAGQAGAFDPEPIKLGDSRDKYDPNARLDLSMDTGIDDYLNRDTGLRLLAQGGKVQKYFMGGPMEPPPVYGIIDVGGQFVETSKDPGPGLISDKDFKEQYQTTTVDKNQQGGGGGMDPNLAPSGQEEASKGLNPGAISALAAGFAQQQMNPPTKPQTLGLEPLAKGGRVKGYMGGGIANVAPGGLGNNTRQGGGGGVPGVAPGGLGNDTRNMGMPAGLGNSLGVKVSGGPKAIGTALNLITGNQEPVYAPLGLESLQAGGYLETGGEVGDGMSDEIEATIEGEQEARLSDGEFVVPADVVSHLGNGSSDAGAKRLYEMMDKIRMARTGTKKQGKEINPGRFMPA